jgi:filamentous hemagglutinin
MVSGKLSGLYDDQGNATRDRSYLVKKAQDTWSASGAIIVSAPFAMSELLPPEMWTAISVLLKEAR